MTCNVEAVATPFAQYGARLHTDYKCVPSQNENTTLTAEGIALFMSNYGAEMGGHAGH